MNWTFIFMGHVKGSLTRLKFI